MYNEKKKSPEGRYYAEFISAQNALLLMVYNEIGQFKKCTIKMRLPSQRFWETSSTTLYLGQNNLNQFCSKLLRRLQTSSSDLNHYSQLQTIED